MKRTTIHIIRVTGGSPNIYLEDAEISVSSGPAINIEGGNPTIHVRGEGNTVASTDNTGIAVSGGATLTIEGRSTADMLTAAAGNGGAGIGSPLGGTVGGTAHAEFAAYAQRIGVGSHAIPYPPSLLNQDGSGPWEGVVINGTVYADGYE